MTDNTNNNSKTKNAPSIPHIDGRSERRKFPNAHSVHVTHTHTYTSIHISLSRKCINVFGIQEGSAHFHPFCTSIYTAYPLVLKKLFKYLYSILKWNINTRKGKVKEMACDGCCCVAILREILKWIERKMEHEQNKKISCETCEDHGISWKIMGIQEP